MHTPRYSYFQGTDLLRPGQLRGSARILELAGRRGIHATSIHTVLELGQHNLNQPRGTVRLWFFALEDLAASFIANHMAVDNPHHANYPFLSDSRVPRDYGNANFFFGWFRHNELRAQFFRGSIHREGFTLPQKAWVQAVPFNYFEKHRWYQLTMTWDEPARDMRLYVNGILVGTSDRFCLHFHREQCGPTLYAGCPALCLGAVDFFDEPLEASAIHAEYRAQATDFDPAIERDLRHRFAGEELADFDFVPGADWLKQLDLDLRDPGHIREFYLQGEAASVRPGAHPDGLLVETPEVTFEPANRHRQVYLWTERTFEGNLYVEFEWQTLRPGGLALLMVHASGMNREDFMADYPRKTTGRMTTVHGENVRNYHWEFYREMHDVRNDVGTAFSRKNPFEFRNGFGCAPHPFAPHQWHRLQFLQTEGHLRGAIDGKILLEVHDHSRTNTGCILNYGHLAIRCMLHSKMLFRNLRVFTQRLPYAVAETMPC
jgi:hypothetical protein